MDRFSQIKKFHHDCRLQIYMYAFMYIDPEKMVEEDYFQYIKTFV